MKIMSISYSDDLAGQNATRARDIMTSPWYQERFNLQLKSDQNRKGYYANTAGGELYSAPIGGQIMGFGANIILIDDPNNTKDLSATALNTVQYRYTNVIFNRLNIAARDVRIIIQQRVHENDLTGYLMQVAPERHRHICLPVYLTDDVRPVELAEHYKPDATGKGMILWPEYFNSETLESYKIMGSKGFSAQYLQKAIPADGGMFKEGWFRYISQQDFAQLSGKTPNYFFVDTAETTSQHNDATSILTCCWVEEVLYITDVVEVRKEFYDLCKFLKEYLAPRWQKDSKLHVEGKASGKSLLSDFRNKTDFSLVELQPGKESKEARAESVTPFVESGRVVLVEGSWNKSFLDQVTGFPFLKNDDSVDTFVYAVKNKKKSGLKIYTAR